MKRQIANVLTMSRLVMAVAIFGLLAFYEGGATGASHGQRHGGLIDLSLIHI